MTLISNFDKMKLPNNSILNNFIFFLFWTTLDFDATNAVQTKLFFVIHLKQTQQPQVLAEASANS